MSPAWKPRCPAPACPDKEIVGDPVFHGLDHVVVELNGAGGCLEIRPTGLAPMQVPGLTLEAWVRPGSQEGAGSQTLVNLPLKDRPLCLQLLPRGAWELGQERTWVRANGVRPGRWQHLAGVCRRDGLALYRNGSPVASLRTPTRLVLPGEAVVGARPRGDGLADCYRGQLARVRLWARALGDEEIRLAMAGRLPAEPGQLADWPLDEGFGIVSPNRAPAAQVEPPATPFGDARFRIVCGWPDYVIARIA